MLDVAGEIAGHPPQRLHQRVVILDAKFEDAVNRLDEEIAVPLGNSEHVRDGTDRNMLGVARGGVAFPSAMNSSISSLQMARTRGSSFFIASGVNGGNSNCLAGLCSGGSEVIGGDRAVISGRTWHDDAAGGKAVGIVGDFLHRLVGGRHVAAEEALGVNDRRRRAQLFPDRKRIFRPDRIGVIEIVDPVGDRGMLGHDAGGIGHRSKSSVWFVQIQMGKVGLGTGLFLGHFDRDLGTVGLREPGLVFQPLGTEPSPTSCALPNSSRSNSSGASDLHRACPWHLSWSTRILSFAAIAAFSLFCALCRALCSSIAPSTRRRRPASNLRSYIILHSLRRCAVKLKVLEHDVEMPPRPARKALNAYHHGDLRDALVQAALHQVERGGPEAISISALAKTLGVSQPAPYKHFADRETLLMAVTAEAFRQFSTMLREAIEKPSKRSKLSRFAQVTFDFGLRRIRHLSPDVRLAHHRLGAKRQRTA